MRVTQLYEKVLLEAEDGFQLRRIADGWIAGTQIYLGYTYYLNGEPLDEPLQELPEHYEEIPIEGYHFPEEDEEPIEETPIEEEPVDLSELDKAIRDKVKASNAYAESLKSVSIYGQEVWKTPSERDNYMSTLQSAQRLGMTEMPFLGMTLKIEDAIRMLDMVNVWAFQVTANKENHESQIRGLNTLAEIEGYDFTTGYPAKIVIK